MSPLFDSQHAQIDAIERGRTLGPTAPIEAHATTSAAEEQAKLSRTYAAVTDSREKWRRVRWGLMDRIGAWTPQPWTEAKRQMAQGVVRKAQMALGVVIGTCLGCLVVVSPTHVLATQLFQGAMGFATFGLVLTMGIRHLFEPARLRAYELALWARSPRAQSYLRGRHEGALFLGVDRWALRHLARQDGLLKRKEGLDDTGREETLA